jgi:predicted transport protein
MTILLKLNLKKEIRTVENYIDHNLVTLYIALKSKHEENNLYPRHNIRT